MVRLLQIRRRLPRRVLHALAEEEARVRRLVVGDVLPGHAEAVLRIVHQRVEAVSVGIVVV